MRAPFLTIVFQSAVRGRESWITDVLGWRWGKRLTGEGVMEAQTAVPAGRSRETLVIL